MDVGLLLIVTFVAPVVEEFTFRYGLTEFDFTRVRVSLSLCGAVLLLFISRLFVDMSIFSSMKSLCIFTCVITACIVRWEGGFSCLCLLLSLGF